MEKEKKLTLSKLKHILKNNDEIKDFHESKQFGQERYVIYFEDVIYSNTFIALKKFNNKFFVMTNDEHLILVIYK